jgi:hypothetical protein
MYKRIIILFLFLLLIGFLSNPNKPIDHFVSFNPYNCKYFYDSHNKHYKPFMCDLFN